MYSAVPSHDVEDANRPDQSTTPHLVDRLRQVRKLDMTTHFSRKSIALATVLCCCFLLSAFYIAPYYHVAKTYRVGATEDDGSENTLCLPVATYITPQALLQMNSAGTIARTQRGLPKIIHQSWQDLDVPIKFKQWSDSIRLRHPDWLWVLWTDDDNAELVETLFPYLKETYWALRNGIQRADFSRNLYMWEFGGLYADLDIECLRPMDNIFDYPSEYAAPAFPADPPISDAMTDPTLLAYVGSMETVDGWWNEHALPNAFMASQPRHPLWLVTLSGVLRNAEVDREKEGSPEYSAEQTTGPIALLRAIKVYRDHLKGGTLHDIVNPLLRDMTGLGGGAHNLVIFDAGVIYPFSWVVEYANEMAYEQSPSTVERVSLKHCLAQKISGHFDPIRCQESVRAYERKAHAITYWSHTWEQGSDSHALDFVGSR